MGKLKLDFVTPERLLYSKDVEQVIVPGSEGELQLHQEYLHEHRHLKISY